MEYDGSGGVEEDELDYEDDDLDTGLPNSSAYVTGVELEDDDELDLYDDVGTAAYDQG